MTRRNFLILVSLLAFAIRAAAVVSMRDLHSPPNRKTTGADGVEYNLLGLHLAQGQGFTLEAGHPTSFRAPGFPLFLAAVYLFSPENYPLVYIFLCLMGSASCVVTYRLGKFLLTENGARIAAVLCAIYPPYVYFATRFDSENLFAPILAFSILLFVNYIRGGSVTALAGSGLALGYCALVRPFTILLVLLLGAALVAHHLRRNQLAIGKAALFICAFGLVILPWTLRNYRVHEHFVLIATNGGSTFYGGNNDIVSTQPRLLGAWVPTTELPGRPEIDRTPTEYAHDQLEWRFGFDWVKSHWLRLPSLEAYKLIRLWLPDIDSQNKEYVLLQLFGYTPFLLLFILGVYRCGILQEYWTEPWLTIHITVAATVLTSLIFWGSPRFRDANAPILMLYAAAAFEKWIERRNQERRRNGSESG
jgi:4-amino-4-deoxy-L-arabinose transferase-like glycosyltransferase